ncbi:MAG TPA: hypothetical protein VMM13_10545 [Euzebya sp.]|nr:hypothetical protein [Euzebya sp.]
MSIRESRLWSAIEALAAERCCGAPPRGGSGATTGMVWEGTEVYISASPPRTDDPDYQAGDIIELAGGQADLGDGAGLPGIGFDCGDTNYHLSHDSTNDDVQVRAAEALLGQLGCTPRVGPAD